MGSFASRRPERFPTSLHGRLACEGRSFPVTVTSLSAEDFVVEGSDLDTVLGPFTLEVAIVSTRGASWISGARHSGSSTTKVLPHPGPSLATRTVPL